MVVFCGLSVILIRKKHKDTFSFIVLFNDEKYQKSFKRAFPPVSATPTNALRALVHSPPLKKLPPRARVSRASRAWQARATRDKSKVAVLPLSAVLTIPRVRTYHTKEPSRFVHALSARPLKVQGGRGWSKYADGMESTFFILAILGCYLVGVGASTTRYGRGINTHASHMCQSLF